MVQLITNIICRVKFWNVAYLEEMDYDKTKIKKSLILPKSQVRSKSNKLAIHLVDEMLSSVKFLKYIIYVVVFEF